MGKKKNSGAASAAQQAAAQQAAPETGQDPKNEASNKSTSKQVQVITLGDLDKLAQQRALAGMDPNHMEDLVGRMDDRFFKDPKAAERYHISQETVDSINEITARAMVALFANEVQLAQTPFAVRMRMSSLEAIQEAGEAMHINIDTKALPAPDKDGLIEVPSTAVKVSEEAEKGLAEERAIAAKKVVLDPTKIENEQQLKDTLLHILVKGNGATENFYEKVAAAINFYESYLSIQANKSDNKEEELQKLKERSRCDFLTDISHMLGKCTFTISGMASFLFEHTQKTGNPVVAFCTFRKASLNKKTGVPQIDDTLVADIVKVLIRWYADTQISIVNESIAKSRCQEEDRRDRKGGHVLQRTI